jgi:hypothetical protein
MQDRLNRETSPKMATGLSWPPRASVEMQRAAETSAVRVPAKPSLDGHPFQLNRDVKHTLSGQREVSLREMHPNTSIRPCVL